MTDIWRGSNVASGVLTTADLMSLNATGGTEASNSTTAPSDFSTTKYMESLSQGGTGTDNAAIPAPTGHGWISGTQLEGQTIPAGNWSAVIACSDGNAPTGCTLVIRFSKRTSGGVYTTIGSLTLTAQTINTTRTQFSLAASSMSAMAFATGDKLYVDRFSINGVGWLGDTFKEYVSNSSTAGVASDLEITTPTHVASVTTLTRTVTATAALLATNTRTVTATAALIATSTRTIPSTAATLATKTRTIPATAALASQRTIPASAALLATNTRTVAASAALLATATRTIPATAALSAFRTIPATTSLLALSALTVSISGVPVTLETDTFTIPDRIDERSQCSFVLADATGTALYSKGQRVIITDSILGRLFSGYIDTANPLNLVPNPFVYWSIACSDNHEIPERRTTNKSYTGQSAGAIAADMYQNVLAAEGVLANVAVSPCTSQADWGTGTLTSVVVGAVGDGDLELAGSGANAGGTFNSLAQWNTGTYSNTQSNGADLLLGGITRNWDDGNKSGQTLYGNGSPSDSIVSGQYLLSCVKLNETRSRFDFAGTWAAGILEYDFALGGDIPAEGPVWLTTNWVNGDGSFAYTVEIKSTQLQVLVGNNGSAGSSIQLGSHTFSPKLGVGMYRVRVVFGSGSHSVYLNGTLILTVSDATWTSAGYVGHRNRNLEPSVTISNKIDNFGIMKAESGSWTSPSTSINTITSIASTMISWDESGSTGGNVNVSTSINGGSTYQAATNGGPIAGLTKGSSGAGKNVIILVTLDTPSTAVMPDIKNLQWSVNGGYLASGSRVSPAIDLSSAVRAGSTFIGWNARTPAGTSLGMDISVGNTTSWVDVTAQNGGPIPGIYGQPDPTVDLFTVDSSAHYSATSQTGGTAPTPTFDTANSRLVLASGANGVYLNGAISRADVDCFADLDLADAGGLVWRFVDQSNYYALVIGDASAGLGTPNTVTLYKVVANVQSQLALASIAFTRGVGYHRFRVTMIGGVITATMDGASLFTYTDGSPLGAGQVGLWNNGGATGSRYYQLWIQPQGDSLAGVLVYTRQRLATSDATVTPQVLDLTVTAFDPSIGNGAIVPQADYLSTFVSANLDDLAKKSDYAWDIDKNVKFIFKGRQAVPAPWVLWSNDPLIRDLLPTYGGDLYSNRQVLTGVVDVKVFPDTKIGDSKATSWALSYPLAAAPTITLNTAPVSVGVKGIDTGKAFYWALGDPTIYQDASGTLLTSSDTLQITGLGTYTTRVVRDNLAGQADRRSVEGGGTGIVEFVTDVSNLGLNIASAQAYGDALNARYGKLGRTVTFNTIKTGLAIGQLISAFVPQRQMINVPLLITAVTTVVRVYGIGSGSANNRYDFLVVATELANAMSWQKQLVAAMK